MRVLRASYPSLLAFAAAVAGFWGGTYYVGDPITELFMQSQRAEMMGSLLSQEEQLIASRAYIDPEDTRNSMESIAYAVRSIPTPFVGYGLEPGEQGNASINSMQFRHAGELKIPKPDGVYRIFVNGGSTAFGSGAPSQDRTIDGFLEKMLNEKLSPRTGVRYEVVNTGNPGWTTTHERILVANRLVDLEPDLVLSLSGNNDVHWGIFGHNVLWFRAYPDEFFWQIVEYHFRRVLGRAMTDVAPPAPAPVSCDLVAKRLMRNVDLMRYVLSRGNVPYVFYLQPTMAVTGKALSEREKEILARTERSYFRTCYDRIRDLMSPIRDPGFVFVDLSTVFDGALPENEIFIDSYHFGDRGNLRIASAIYKSLRSILRSD